MHNAPIELPPPGPSPPMPPPPVLVPPTRAGPPRPVLHRALPSPTPQNTPQGMGSEWKNLPGTTHTDKQTPLLYYIRFNKSVCLSVCLSVWSFQVSRNEGSICLGTWRQEVLSDDEETWIWSRRYRNLKICNGNKGRDSKSQEMRGLSVLGTWRPIYRHMTRRFQVSKISGPGVWN